MFDYFEIDLTNLKKELIAVKREYSNLSIAGNSLSSDLAEFVDYLEMGLTTLEEVNKKLAPTGLRMFALERGRFYRIRGRNCATTVLLHW